MQVTDEMVAAAMKAFRLQPPDLNVPDPEGMYIDHRRMHDAIQAAINVSPEQAMPRMWQLPTGDVGTDEERAEWLRVHGAALRQAGDAVWLSKAGADNPEEPTVADETTKPPAPGFDASTPTALGSFTFPLDDRSAVTLLDPDQVAEHLGVSTSQVDDWIRLGPAIRFPEPYKWAFGIPSWQLAVIDQWYALWKASNGG